MTDKPFDPNKPHQFVVDADKGGTLDYLRVSHFRRAATVHNQAEEPL